MPQDFALEARLALLAFEDAERRKEEDTVSTHRDYAAGRQPVYLTDRQKEYMGLNAKSADYPYAHNICRLIIDVLAERLRVTGFDDVGDETNDAETDDTPTPVQEQQQTNGKTLAEYASEWFDYNRMDAGQDDLHEATLRDASAFILVDWEPDKGYPRWTITQASDGKSGVRMFKDPETNDAAFATKQWQIDDPLNPAINGLKRLNIYYPNRVEKYISKPLGKVFDPHIGEEVELTGWVQWYDMVDGNGAPIWPLPWTEDGTLEGEPLGLAIIPFEAPGGSVIGDVVPIQDMLNKADVDLAAAADMAGFRVYWGTGITAQNDSSGNEVAIPIGPGVFARFGAADARVGVFEPADLKPIIDVGSYWIQSAAGVTRTPQHLFQPFGGQPPSGESLKEQESGLVSKAVRCQRVFGNSWEDVIYLSARLWNIYSSEQAKIGRLQTVWDDAETRNEKIAAETAGLKDALGIPKAQLWAEMGYDAQQIEDFEAQGSSSVTGGLLAALMQQGQAGTEIAPVPEQPIDDGQ